MSLIEKDNLNYLTTVEQFFLALKNSGLSLSAVDYHLINQWEERGVPVEVLCRAIEKGFNRYKETSMGSRVSLRYFQNMVDEEIESVDL
ncbi:MAG: hypothetical protein CL402_06135 [Acidiferrobacteraceae bacterium]|nr:hypothetical protein [Acidiferrobacteraceae bacterium]|tara:strand:- start:527 stop:793 length:267 start_codon:yes stop_codon:yes gene_type:complete